MAIKWIIADLDGCVSPEESVPWDVEAFMSFARLCREASRGNPGMPLITLCTGRPQPYVEALAKILDIRAPMICESGAVFYSLHDNFSRYGPGVTQEKIEGLRSVRGYLESKILPRFRELLLQFGKEAQISVFSERPEIFPQIVPEIEAFVASRGGPELTISPSHYYLNISLKGVNKGASLDFLMKELGVTREETAGIGDTVGDLPVRERVVFFACPSNATPEVKAAADYVSPCANLQGMLDILRQPPLAGVSA